MNQRILWGILLLIGGLLAVWMVVRDQPDPANPESIPGISSELDSSDDHFDMVAARSQVAGFCGDCHAVPTPDQFPQAAWPEEIDDGYRFYFDSGRRDLKMPPKQLVLEYYRRLAPKEMPVKTASPLEAKPRVRFLPTHHAYTEFDDLGKGSPPAVANVRWFGKPPDSPLQAKPALWVCDMRRGFLVEMLLSQEGVTYGRRALVPHPAHTTVVDLDRDGKEELLVADLGSFLPEDHGKGQVLWLRPDSTGDGFEQVKLLGGVGRVTDIETADFDRDGDQDLVVAEFGWRTTGQIHLLENLGLVDGIPRFRARVVDDRHGCISVTPTDLNQDGYMDFVALISQEHECVVGFYNRGDGTFRVQTVFSADNPSYGTSGLQPADLDQDGDIDLIYTNGDMFDRFYVAPYHGIHWLEHMEDGSWKHHLLASMSGVHRAAVADFDNDGDLDLVACALISDNIMQKYDGNDFNSLIWLEQVADRKFVRHALETGDCYHATADVADFDNDGDVDIAVGQFREISGTVRSDVTIWWNQTLSSTNKSATTADRGNKTPRN